jgi:Phage major capsid protein E
VTRYARSWRRAGEAFKAQRDSAVARVSPRTLGPWSTAEAPADFVETSNTIRLPCNAKQAVDQQFARWVMLHVQSNPLPMCTRSRGPIMGKLT